MPLAGNSKSAVCELLLWLRGTHLEGDSRYCCRQKILRRKLFREKVSNHFLNRREKEVFIYFVIAHTYGGLHGSPLSLETQHLSLVEMCLLDFNTRAVL